MSTVSKKKAIEQLVDASVKNFAEGISERHIREVTDPNGVINGKRNNEYFMLKNQFPDANIKLRFATAYNRFGEGNAWKQSSVRRCFAEEELMIGKDYWNFICKDKHGFDIVLQQYKKSAIYIQKALNDIKDAYIS